MGIARLADALRLPPRQVMALVGAGGKTSALFRIARELEPPVWVTTSTHFAEDQAIPADRAVQIPPDEEIQKLKAESWTGIAVITGLAGIDHRLAGLSEKQLHDLHLMSSGLGVPFLIEADGSKMLPLKAPAAHEPAVPDWVEQVVVTAGLSGLGKPLSPIWVHRPEIFAGLSGLHPGDAITADGLERVLADPQGGLKNIPTGAEVSLLLNQADNAELVEAGWEISSRLMGRYSRAVVASLKSQQVHAVIEPSAGIVLAAGAARRMGSPKQLLDWRGKPFVRVVTETALAAGLSPVIVVVGSARFEIGAVLHGLPVTVVYNPEWEGGQGSSVAAGVRSLPHAAGSAVFLLADQPQVGGDVIQQLVRRHAQTLAPVIAPWVSGRRANPVLFDRLVFPELASLKGDEGGRVIFAKFPPEILPWADERLLIDIDTPEDYRKLLESD